VRFYTLLVLTLVAACSPPTAQPLPDEKCVINYLDVVQINTAKRSYLQIERPGTPHGCANEILKLLGSFEVDHTDLEILPGWRIEKRQTTGSYKASQHGYPGDYIYGIWVDHKPRVAKDTTRR